MNEEKLPFFCKKLLLGGKKNLAQYNNPLTIDIK